MSASTCMDRINVYFSFSFALGACVCVCVCECQCVCSTNCLLNLLFSHFIQTFSSGVCSHFRNKINSGKSKRKKNSTEFFCSFAAFIYMFSFGSHCTVTDCTYTKEQIYIFYVHFGCNLRSRLLHGLRNSAESTRTETHTQKCGKYRTEATVPS